MSSVYSANATEKGVPTLKKTGIIVMSYLVMRASSLLAFRCYFELPSINKDFTSLHYFTLEIVERVRCCVSVYSFNFITVCNSLDGVVPVNQCVTVLKKSCLIQRLSPTCSIMCSFSSFVRCNL